MPESPDLSWSLFDMSRRNYQTDVRNFIVDKEYCGIFAEMGLGKTGSTLSAITDLMLNRFKVGRTLVIAPLRVATMAWPDEIKKWGFDDNITYVVLHGSKKKELLLNEAQKADIVFINYDGLKWLAKNGRHIPKFDMMVLDESTFIKNQSTVRFKIVRQLAQLIPRRVLLTGTPTPNSLMDLWAQVYILDGGDRLGRSFYAFRNTYFIKGDHFGYKWYLKKGAKDAIYEKISDIVLVLRTKDHIKMPGLKYNKINLELPSKNMSEYTELEEELFLQLDESTSVEALNQASLSSKLRQYISGFLYTDDPDEKPEGGFRSYSVVHRERLKVLKELIESLNGSPLMCCVQFRAEIALIRKALGKDLPAIFGGTGGAEGVDILRRWNSGDIPLLLVHPASVSHGLNLQTGGCNLLFYSMTWSLEHYDQVKSRLWRPGQMSDEVMIHQICMKGTIDEVIATAVSGKNKTQQGLMKGILDYRSSKLAN